MNPAQSGDSGMTPRTFSPSQTCPPKGPATFPQAPLFSPCDIMDQEPPVEGTDGQSWA